nr:hypothetical protein [Enterobacter kobei]
MDFYDENLFGNEAGEDEDPKVLSSYFITKEKFNKFMSLQRSFGIVRARKGMGKSSLLSKLAYDVSNKDNRAIVISVTGADLLSYGNFEHKDHLSLQNEWKKALSTRINFDLGSRIGFAWTDHQMALVESAELVGYKDKNLLDALLSRIKIKNYQLNSLIPIQKIQLFFLSNIYLKTKMLIFGSLLMISIQHFLLMKYRKRECQAFSLLVEHYHETSKVLKYESVFEPMYGHL